MSIRSYQWGRRITPPEGMATDPIYAELGIVAGSSFATYELMAYLLGSIERVIENNRNTSMKIHVDDVSMTGRGDTDVEAATEIGPAAGQMAQEVEGDIAQEPKAQSEDRRRERRERQARTREAPETLGRRRAVPEALGQCGEAPEA